MQPLDLNLSARPFRNNVLLWVGYSAALGALLLFGAYSINNYVKHKRLLSMLNSEVNSIDGQTQDLQVRDEIARDGIEKHDLPTLELQAEKANEVIEGKAFSWTRLFNLLAEIQPNDVRMTSIRPIFRVERGPQTADRLASSSEQRSVPVAIHAVARSYADMLEMQSALIDDAHFGRLEMERLFRAQNNREYIFQLSFLYYPDTVPEPEEPPAEIEKADQGGDEPAVEGDEAAVTPGGGEPVAPAEGQS